MLLGKETDRIVVSTEQSVFEEEFKGETEALPLNTLVKIDRETLEIKRTPLVKQFKVDRKPRPGFGSIYEEEIVESAQTVATAIDHGNKLSSNHTVIIGGLESAKEDLMAIKHLVINAHGSSRIAAEFGRLIISQLGVFETIQVIDSHMLKKDMLPDKFGGMVSLSQSGEDQVLLNNVQLALENEMECFNITNNIDSALSKLVKTGLYMNAGYCYCDVKTFASKVVSLAISGVWFSQNSPNAPESKKLRKQILEDIKSLHLNTL